MRICVKIALVKRHVARQNMSLVGSCTRTQGRDMNYPILLPLVLVLSMSMAGTTSAQQLYKHVDEKGRVVYSDAPPATNNEVKSLTKGGRVSTAQEATLTPDQVRQREAEIARKKEADRLFNEQRRRDMTLLATYTNTRDIDLALTRNLQPIDARTRSAQERLDAIEVKEKQINDEMEFYVAGRRKTKDAKPTEVPAELLAQQQALTREKAQIKLAITRNDQEIVATRERFTADKERWQKLQTGILPGQSPEPQFQMAKADGGDPAKATPAAPNAAPTATNTTSSKAVPVR
jgi:Domain of unknown function (DUF4124)